MSDDPSKPYDPRGLIREAFRIDGIGAEDCRAIFFDWVMGLKPGEDVRAHADALRGLYADQPSDHPMHALLSDAAKAPGQSQRGRRRRRSDRSDGAGD